MSRAIDIKPITYLKNRTADLVREVHESGRTVTITRNGEAEAVVMDVALYDRWRSTMALLKILALAEADAEAGQTVTQTEAFRRAAAAVKRRKRNG